jgi:ubiquinone/menaquinone biosynthesis C-methylase UbiE
MINEKRRQELRYAWLTAHKGYYFRELKNRVLDLQVQLLQPSTTDIFLDLGCGWGDNLFPLSRRVKISVGMDISRAALKMTKKSGKFSKSNHFIVGDANHLPFVEGVFSKVLFSHIIEHLQEPEKALNEIYRVMKQEGTFLCITPNASSYRTPPGLLTRALLSKFSHLFSGLQQNQQIRAALRTLNSLESSKNSFVHELDHVHEFESLELVTFLEKYKFKVTKQNFTGFHIIGQVLYDNDAIGNLWAKIAVELEHSPFTIQSALLTDMYCLAHKP